MKTKKKQSVKDYLFHFCNCTFFAIFTLICAYPFYYLIINSISANDLSAAGKINLIPKGIQFQNYIAFVGNPSKTSVLSACILGAYVLLRFSRSESELPTKLSIYGYGLKSGKFL